MNDLLRLLDDAEASLLIRTGLGIAVMLGLVLLLQRLAGVGFKARAISAVARAILQLGLASVILSGVLNVPWTVVAVLLFMLSMASWTSAQRIRGMPGGAQAAVLGVAAGAVVAVGLVFGLGMMPWSTRNLIAIGGIIIGSSLTAATLAGRHFRTLAYARSGEVEAWWALGANSPKAFAKVAQEAVRDALIPNMDQTRSTGVVTLPGAFIGALFGGSSPLEAARFQVVVLVGIMLAQTLTAIVVTRRLSRMTTLPPPEG